MNPPLRYGLIGCGGFGRYCLGQYQTMPELTCVAVADVDPDLARTTAEAHQMENCSSPAALLARTDIDLVHLATPPFTHHALATAALKAGLHVLCEKPLALTLTDAEQMIRLAVANQRLLAVNLIMRYNPLCHIMKQLVESRILGEPLYASLVNAAQDETLAPGHWFWDREKSGGIFIEHGVHFFDLFEWWFGPGEVVSAHQLERPGTAIIDQVQCAVRHGEGTLATFYHGFHQMLRRDQQSWLIAFEQGMLTMSEWVPTRLVLDVTVDEAALSAVSSLIPTATVQIVERYTGEGQTATSRHRSRTVDMRATITSHPGLTKQALYGEMVRDLMRDQIKAIHDSRHVRLVSEGNGLSSLAYATAAQAMAG